MQDILKAVGKWLALVVVLVAVLLGAALGFMYTQVNVGDLPAYAVTFGGGELPQQTRDFVQAFSARDALGLMQTLTPMEKWKRDALADTLEGWRELLESALASRSGIRAVSPLSRKLAQSRSSPELLNAVQCLQKAVDYTTGNVSPAAVCGWLEWALR